MSALHVFDWALGSWIARVCRYLVGARLPAVRALQASFQTRDRWRTRRARLRATLSAAWWITDARSGRV